MNIQGSPEWFAERLGHATASRAADMLAKTKTGYGASRDDYLWELAIERITGKPVEGFTSKDMERGIELEPAARMAFEAATGLLMEEVGFIKHPTILMCGASPDGICGREGMEAKCPRAKAHGYSLLNGHPPKYDAQMQFQMWCADLEAVWYVSYCEDFPPELRLFYERVTRDDARIKEIEVETVKFLGEVEATTSRLRDAMMKKQERANEDERQAA